MDSGEEAPIVPPLSHRDVEYRVPKNSSSAGPKAKARNLTCTDDTDETSLGTSSLLTDGKRSSSGQYAEHTAANRAEGIPEVAVERITGFGHTSSDHNQTAQASRCYTGQRVLLGACVVANIASVALAVALLFPFFTEEVLKIFPTQETAGHVVAGIVFSTTTAVEAMVAPITALDLHNAGEKNVLVVSLFLVSGSLLLFGFVNKIKSWSAFVTLAVLIRVVQGVGSGANYTAAYTLLVNAFPESTGTVNGLIRGLMGFGLAVGPALGGYLYDAGGFGLPLFVVAGLLATTSFANTILLVACSGDSAVMGKPKQTKAKNSNTTFRQILSFPWVWLCVLLLGMGIAMGGLFESTVSQYMKTTFGTSSGQGGLAILLYSATFGGISFLCGYVIDRWICPRRMCLFGLCLAILSFMLYGPASILPTEPSVTLTYISSLPYGMAVAVLMTSAPEDMLRTLRQRDVGDVSDVSAYVGAVTQVGISLFYTPGLLLGPVLSATVGLRMLSSFLAALYLSLGLLFLVSYLISYYRNKRAKQEGKGDTWRKSHGNVPSTDLDTDNQIDTVPLVESGRRMPSEAEQ